MKFFNLILLVPIAAIIVAFPGSWTDKPKAICPLTLLKVGTKKCSYGICTYSMLHK